MRSKKVPPRLGGFGPLAWQQMQRAIRTSAKSIIILLLMGLSGSILMVLSDATVIHANLAAALFFFAVFILPRFIVFDFRTSGENMQYLKTLPVSAKAICLAQVVVPILLSTGIEVAMLLAASPFLDIGIGVLSVIALMLLLFNGVLYLTENIIYLFYPTPLVPVGRVDFDFMGRTLGEFLCKSVVLSAVFGLSILCAYAISQSSAANQLIIFSSLIGLPALACAFMLYILTVAFRRFDVTFQSD